MERIRVPLRCRGKTELIRELVEVLARAGDVEEPDDVARAVLEREEVLSTGVGRGIAVPHAQCASVEELHVACGRTAGPVDFDSLDGEPVRLLFLLVAPRTSAGRHVQLLREISRVMGREEVRRSLVETESAEGFYRVLAEAEAEA